MGKTENEIAHVSVERKDGGAWSEYEYKATIVTTDGRISSDTSIISAETAINYAKKHLD